jgi:hypothetical protein
MRNFITPLICGFLLLAAIADGYGSADSNNSALPPQVLARKSIFLEENHPSAKDPFFPGRRLGAQKNQPTRADEPVVAVTPPPPPVQPNLFLRGISGAPNRLLALINGQTFQAGEEAYVKTTNGTVKVLCHTITQTSVVITVNGREKKELRLREGI